MAKIKQLKTFGRKIFVPYSKCKIIAVDLNLPDPLDYPSTIFDSLEEIGRNKENPDVKLFKIVYHYVNKAEDRMFYSSIIRIDPETLKISMKIHSSGIIYLDPDSNNYYFDISPIGN